MQRRRGLYTSWSALELFVSVIECSLDEVRMRMMTIREIKNGGEIHIDITTYHSLHLTIRHRTRKLSTSPQLPSTYYVSPNHNHSVVVFKMSINLHSDLSCCTKEKKCCTARHTCGEPQNAVDTYQISYFISISMSFSMKPIGTPTPFSFSSCYQCSPTQYISNQNISNQPKPTHHFKHKSQFGPGPS